MWHGRTCRDQIVKERAHVRPEGQAVRNPTSLRANNVLDFLYLSMISLAASLVKPLGLVGDQKSAINPGKAQLANSITSFRTASYGDL